MSLADAEMDGSLYAHLRPINSLSEELLNKFISNSSIERLPPGRRLFSIGDSDSRTIYLLSGQLAMMAEEGTRRAMESETKARSPG